MGNLFSRIGITGLSIVAAALIFGVLAGGIVVHRLEASPAASQSEQQQQQGEASDRQDRAKKHGHGHPSKPHPAESPEPQEND